MLSASAQNYSCNTYPPTTVVAQLKAQVELLRRFEREAADRLVGLDTRPYEWLLAQARAAEAVIAVPAQLAAEQDALARCGNRIRTVRRDCAMAAGTLVRVLDELVMGEATSEAKVAYAQAMPLCERSAGLTPINTTLRVLK
jgi:multidrug resistance efflux pump